MLGAKKSYGQHFLTDRNIAKKIVRFAALSHSDAVLEIGAGYGALTEHLVAQAALVLAVEIDRELAAALRRRFSSQPNLVVIEGDFMQLDLASLCNRRGLSEREAHAIGNLPYNLATAIIERLLEHKRLFKSITVMVQREVAGRISSPPGSKSYGFLTNLVWYHAVVEPGFVIKPGSFSPRPKVDSQVIKLVPLERAGAEGAADYGRYLRLLKAAFAYRRKTLFNNLKRSEEFGARAAEALAACNIEPSRRAESLQPEELLALANWFAREEQA